VTSWRLLTPLCRSHSLRHCFCSQAEAERQVSEQSEKLQRARRTTQRAAQALGLSPDDNAAPQAKVGEQAGGAITSFAHRFCSLSDVGSIYFTNWRRPFRSPNPLMNRGAVVLHPSAQPCGPCLVVALHNLAQPSSYLFSFYCCASSLLHLLIAAPETLAGGHACGDAGSHKVHAVRAGSIGRPVAGGKHPPTGSRSWVTAACSSRALGYPASIRRWCWDRRVRR
jgi:hypothetical protein